MDFSINPFVSSLINKITIPFSSRVCLFYYNNYYYYFNFHQLWVSKVFVFLVHGFRVAPTMLVKIYGKKICSIHHTEAGVGLYEDSLLSLYNFLIFIQKRSLLFFSFLDFCTTIRG